ncbi:MAG: EipB family protein [Hyphomicrobiales bacterium]
MAYPKENPSSTRHIAGIGAVTLFCAIAAPWELAHAMGEKVGVVPHRAYYQLRLSKMEERSGIREATGRMVIEITGSRCDGWAVNVRFANAFTVQKGQSRVLDNVDSYYEAGDGSLLQFSSRQYLNGNLQNETKGTAKIDLDEGKSKGGSVKLDQPPDQNFKLPAGTIFPLAHTERLLQRAAGGDNFDQIRIYDGDAKQTIYFASSVIGKRRAELEDSSGVLEPLAGVAYWPVNVSYYDSKRESYAGGEQVPSHQVGYAMFANGVSGDLTIDYGDFSLKGKLSKLEMLEKVECE